MLRVGLTGGIASGKSHVAGLLAQAGLRCLDLDRVGHEVLAPGASAYADVVAAFGPGVVAADGTIDRKALAAIVFADAGARLRLNAIVHPRIRAVETRLWEELRSEPGAVLVVEGAVLVEAGLHLRYDRLLVAHCGLATQRDRLSSRDGLADDAVAARLAAQMAPEQKRRFAHFVIDTSGSFATTERETAALADELRRLASQPPGALPLAPAQAAELGAGPGEFGGPGLTPTTLLRHMAAGLDLAGLARELRLSPPWYAAHAGLDQAPDALAGAVALFGLARRGDDPDYTAAVAYSIACLTHTRPADRAHAILAALALQERVVGAGSAPGARSRALAARWSGSEPGPQAVAAAAAGAAALGTRTVSPSPEAASALRQLLASRAS